MDEGFDSGNCDSGGLDAGMDVADSSDVSVNVDVDIPEIESAPDADAISTNGLNFDPIDDAEAFGDEATEVLEPDASDDVISADELSELQNDADALEPLALEQADATDIPDDIEGDTPQTIDSIDTWLDTASLDELKEARQELVDSKMSELEPTAEDMSGESIDQTAKVLTRDPDELRSAGYSAIEANLEAVRDNFRDSGMSDGEEMEALIQQERESLQKEFEQDAFLYGEVGDGVPNKSSLKDTIVAEPDALADVISADELSELQSDAGSLEPLALEQANAIEIPDGMKGIDTAHEDMPLTENNLDEWHENASLDELREAKAELIDSKTSDLEPTVEDVSVDQAAMVLTRDPDELRSAGYSAIEANLEAVRDNFRDNGMSDGEEMEALIRQERGSLQKEFEQDAFHYGEVNEATDMEVQDQLDERDGVDKDAVNEVIKSIMDQNVTTATLPSSKGSWEGDRGNGSFRIDDAAEITYEKNGRHTMSGGELKQLMMEKGGQDFVEYKNKEPDFSPFEDGRIGHVELETFSTDREGGTYDLAENTLLADEKSGFLSKAEIRAYMAENGLTWHECADGKTVRAVPTAINAAFKHTGGISIERSKQAMRESIKERFGPVVLERESPTGTVDANELRNAQKAVKQMYAEKKREMF